MKSSNPSLRRLAFAAAVLAAGNFAFAQSSTASSAQGASNTSNGTMQNSSEQNDTNANSMSNNSTSNDQSSMSSNNDNSSGKDKLSWGDRHFLRKAADGGESEVALGQLAQEKASNPDVRQFGQTLVQDHTQADSQLMQIAQEKNVKIDQDNEKDRTYKRLSKMSGSDFDREFVDHEVDDHEKDIKMFEKEAQNAKDPDVRQFASTVLPKLREHLAMAQRLQNSIVPTSNTSTGFSGSSNSSNSTNGSSTGNSNNNSSSNGNSANGAGVSPSNTTTGSTSAGASSSTSTTP